MLHLFIVVSITTARVICFNEFDNLILYHITLNIKTIDVMRFQCIRRFVVSSYHLARNIKVQFQKKMQTPNGVIFNELNTAMKWTDRYIPENQFILVRDGTTSSDGGFLVHHYLNSFLNQGRKVKLCSFNQSFFHYNTIELKLNINLEKESQEGRFTFIDAQQSFLNVDGGDNSLLFTSPLLITKVNTQPSQQPSCVVSFKSNDVNSLEGYLNNLFEQLTRGEDKPSCIILDHINPLLHYFFDQDLNKHIVKFITRLRKHYNHQVTVICLVYNDSKEVDGEFSQLTNMLEHASDIVFRVGALPTGYSKDVHGRMECIARPMQDDAQLVQLKKVTLHFKTFESKVALFTPGSVNTSHNDSFLF